MTYTGETYVGGPVEVRELSGLTIAKLAVGRMDNNAYLVRCTADDDALLIDAAAEPDRIAELTRLHGARTTQILTTHRHADHWGALVAAAHETNASILAGEPDAAELPVAVDVRLVDGDTVTVGDCTLTVIALRGHTPGSVALLYQDPSGPPHVFTGDSLFPGGVGKTWSPADFTSLLDDVSTRVFDRLPDETWVYPGHGHDTTLGAERPHLQEWRDRGW